MRTNVRVTPQVESFVKSLAPEPRGRLTHAIKALAKDQGDRKQLEGKLQGYLRLRVAGYRVICRARAEKGERFLDCIFAENRAVVYELFLRLLSEGLPLKLMTCAPPPINTCHVPNVSRPHSCNCNRATVLTFRRCSNC